jgi:hypothetical protein
MFAGDVGNKKTPDKAGLYRAWEIIFTITSIDCLNQVERVVLVVVVFHDEIHQYNW